MSAKVLIEYGIILRYLLVNTADIFASTVLYLPRRSTQSIALRATAIIGVLLSKFLKCSLLQNVKSNKLLNRKSSVKELITIKHWCCIGTSNTNKCYLQVAVGISGPIKTLKKSNKKKTRYDCQKRISHTNKLDYQETCEN